ncbi:ferredoxin--NADP reductase [Sediminibacterium soli]|uniref:ferredoxin--NADP reductase n=1 Tax=Sediminibacterium soli TaxID=2698829 RepID=UPI001379C759|nr:FAD-dependent oxidoreductase [Sediminibacterium soli]NCI45575.1 FAD-dependent oxidoreductase [Sediminibacterium soli]
MLEPWRKGIVTRIENATAQTRRFWIQVPELERFDFKPGQFVTLDLPIHEQRNKRWRSYSIASAPDGTNVFELVIVLLEGGLGTQYLFSEVSVGSELTLRGPQGKFTLPDEIQEDIYLICTGTGIAPFRSMAQFLHAHALPHRHIHLIFGCRTLADGLYVDELRTLEREEPGFHFHPCYSREEDVPERAHKGYVHPVYETLTENGKKPAKFFLCGWKVMIDEAKQRILDMGYDRKAIHLELYG